MTKEQWRLISILPVCIFTCAWSFLGFFWSNDPEEKARLKRFVGWFDKIEEPSSEGSWAHWYKNRLVEWVRDKPTNERTQGAAKFLCFLIALFFVIAVAGWAAFLIK